MKEKLQHYRNALKKRLEQLKNKKPKESKNALKDAYLLLGLEYPTTYEHIRDAYYITVFNHEPKEDTAFENKCKAARERIEQNIFQDPDANIEETTSIKPKKWHLPFKFGKKRKKTISYLIENNKEPKRKQPKIRIAWGPTIFLCLMGILVSMAISTRNKPIISTTEDKEDSVVVPDVSNIEEGHEYTATELSISLLERDGIDYKGDTLKINPHRIDKLNTSERKIFNYYIFKRSFELSDNNLTYDINAYSVYRNSEVGSEPSKYSKLRDFAKIKITGVDLSGKWNGEGLLLGKYALRDIVLDIDVKESGYVTGLLEFIIDDKEASINVEGQINKDTLEATFGTSSWNKRPNLLVSPIILDGTLNIYDGSISSTKKTSFILKKEVDSSEEFDKEVQILLKKEYCEYNSTDICSILMDNLDNLEYHITDDSKEKKQISYTADLQKDVAKYKVGGKAILHKDDNTDTWFISDNTAKATLKEIVLSGEYTGTEQMDDKTWNVTYTIDERIGNSYTADVKLISGINTVVEKRLLEVIDNKQIRVSRLDVLEGKVFEMKPYETDIDFSKDGTKGILDIQRKP